jgi:ribosomal protein S18 acetylase RimI-like enzyme
MLTVQEKHKLFKLKVNNCGSFGGQITKSSNSINELKTIIRQGELEDAERFNEIEKACFPRNLQYGPSIIVALLTMKPNYTVLAAQLIEQSKIVAFAVGEQDDNNLTLGRIITILVDPAYQGKKIGRTILGKLESKLRKDHKVKKFELQVHSSNENAIKFYEKQGYRVKKRLKDYYERKQHAFLMEKMIH